VTQPCLKNIHQTHQDRPTSTHRALLSAAAASSTGLLEKYVNLQTFTEGGNSPVAIYKV